MIRIKIQYDKYNRTFKLLDKQFGPLLEDGDIYELPVPALIPEEGEDGSAVFEIGVMAHA